MALHPGTPVGQLFRGIRGGQRDPQPQLPTHLETQSLLCGMTCKSPHNIQDHSQERYGQVNFGVYKIATRTF